MPLWLRPDGGALHYRDENPRGSRAVVLLHGLGATAASWELQFPALTAAGWRILAPDAPGFGRSDPFPGGPVTIERTGRLLAAWLRAVAVPPLAVVGISLGGTHALALALDHPELVTRLVLVNTFARLRPRALSVWFYYALRLLLVHTVGLEAQARAVTARIFPRPEQADLRRQLVAQIGQADPAAYRATMRALARFDVSARLPLLSIPTLVVTAGADSTVPPAVQAELRAALPAARQVVVADAGHAVSVDHPAEFNAHLLNFLMPTL
jgi:pimeloyl-ACP methyl ester carboxylesterase